MGYLNKILEKYPNAKVITSSDNEGNFFNPVFYGPSVGKFSEQDGDFIPEDHFEDSKTKVNAVCLN